MEQQAQQGEPTFGEKLAGTTFNPSNDGAVDKVKQAAAKFMDAIHEAQNEMPETQRKAVDGIFDAAKLRALESQMLAVKAITWKY